MATKKTTYDVVTYPRETSKKKVGSIHPSRLPPRYRKELRLLKKKECFESEGYDLCFLFNFFFVSMSKDVYWTPCIILDRLVRSSARLVETFMS